MSTVAKWVVFVGGTFSGHEHDYTMLKTEFPPEHPWFENLHALLDLGYQGILNDYVGENIEIRIFVENAIAGIKRFNILVHTFRNRKANMEDDVIALCAGLWNFLLL